MAVHQPYAARAAILAEYLRKVAARFERRAQYLAGS
jgi:hypothetical protein